MKVTAKISFGVPLKERKPVQFTYFFNTNWWLHVRIDENETSPKFLGISASVQKKDDPTANSFCAFMLPAAADSIMHLGF